MLSRAQGIVEVVFGLQHVTINSESRRALSGEGRIYSADRHAQVQASRRVDGQSEHAQQPAWQAACESTAPWQPDTVAAEVEHFRHAGSLPPSLSVAPL